MIPIAPLPDSLPLRSRRRSHHHAPAKTIAYALSLPSLRRAVFAGLFAWPPRRRSATVVRPPSPLPLSLPSSLPSPSPSSLLLSRLRWAYCRRAVSVTASVAAAPSRPHQEFCCLATFVLVAPSRPYRALRGLTMPIVLCRRRHHRARRHASRQRRARRRRPPWYLRLGSSPGPWL